LTPISVKLYRKLKPGDELQFETVSSVEGKLVSTFRPGKLVYLQARWKDTRNKKGDIIARELVGSRVGFEPLDPEDCTREWPPTREALKIYTVHVCCGLFKIYTLKPT